MKKTEDAMAPRIHEHAGEVLRRRQLLEDQLFKRILPHEFQRICRFVGAVDGRAHARILKRMVEDLVAAIPRNRVIDIQSRMKHLFSIYRKLQRKSCRPEEIYDLFGLRVICPTEEECRLVLRTIHDRYRPVPGRLKDYITTPKATGYRSIYTTVHSPSGHPVEIQIRTLAMHFEAETDHTYYKQEA